MEVAQADFLIPAVPLESYEKVCKMIKPYLAKNTVIVDVCSVKVKPIQLLRSHFPNQPLVATHPMFGPESASASLDDHAMVLCPEVSTDEPYQKIKRFSENVGLKVVELSCEEHDKGIAVVQGLTFFVARTLKTMGIHDQVLHTPSFQRLLNLVELERHHSQQLFETIQLGNEYTTGVREYFLRAAQAIDDELKSK
jgi:prephenate dehydrogenase